MNAPIKLSDLQAMSAHFAEVPTGAQLYAEHFEDMLRFTREGEAGHFATPTLDRFPQVLRDCREAGLLEISESLRKFGAVYHTEEQKLSAGEAAALLKLLMGASHPDVEVACEDAHAALEEDGATQSRMAEVELSPLPVRRV